MAIADITYDDDGNAIWTVNPAFTSTGSSSGSGSGSKAWIIGIVAVLAVLAAAKIAK